jgi:glutamine amidotransferase
MYNLIESGILDVLEAKALVEKVPVLGICLGMQMLFEGSEEGKLDGLGWLRGKCVRFDAKQNPGLKVPHMGWNEVRVQNMNGLFENLVTDARFYHVHSYKVVCADSGDITAVCHYGEDFTCAVSRGNIYGVQFHPEKSHKFGVQFFKNFLRLVKND